GTKRAHLRGPVARRRADNDTRLAKHGLKIGLAELEPDRLCRWNPALAGIGRRSSSARRRTRSRADEHQEEQEQKKRLPQRRPQTRIAKDSACGPSLGTLLTRGQALARRRDRPA